MDQVSAQEEENTSRASSEKVDYKAITLFQQKTLKDLANVLAPWSDQKDVWILPIRMTNETGMSVHFSLYLDDDHINILVKPRTKHVDDETFVLKPDSYEDLDMERIYERFRR